MDTVLSRATPAHLATDPFPHLVVTDALDTDELARLTADMPPFETILRGSANPQGRLAGNTRVHLLAQELLGWPTIAASWRAFVANHTSQAFFNQLLALSADAIRRMHPDLERRFGSLDAIRAGVRGVDSHATADLLLDALLVLNTPVTARPNSVRRVHLDSPHKLFTGLLYLRDPDDRSSGGDLELYTFKGGQPQGFEGREVRESAVELAKTIRYERNVLVLMLNSIRSLHGVTVRSVAPRARRYVSLVGELATPLFDPSPYAAPPRPPLERAYRKLRSRVVGKLRSFMS